MKAIKRISYSFIDKLIRWGRIQSNLRLIQQGILTVGKYTYGTENLIIKIYKGSEAKVHIGNFCSIGENITIITGGIHPTNWISTFPLSERFSSKKIFQDGMPSTKGDIWIGNDVWIAQNTTILSGIRIGDGAVICSGAVVTKDIPDYSIVGGVPAKVLRYRFSDKQIQSLITLKWWNWPIEKIEKNINMISSSKIDEFLISHINFKNE